MIYVEGDGYYAYATHDAFSPTLNNVQVCHSPDLVNWSQPKGALILPPSWAQACERFWAPQVVKVNAEYRLYYSAEPDTRDGMCLAVAHSAAPVAFTDMGAPLSQKKASSYEMIDPCFFIDPQSGKHLLYYGSAHQPIYVVEMAPDGKSFINDPAPIIWPDHGVRFEQLREGAFITYKQQYNRYYMWVSGDNTWAPNSYAVSVFWADNPFGPFQKIPNYLVLKPNDHWDCCGQNCIITDAAGEDWIIYHAVDTSERFIKGTDHFLRKMCMDKVQYDKDGWPYIENGSPSFERKIGPAINITVDALMKTIQS